MAVVVPNWNGLDFIGECLESLGGQTQPGRIIVVDNGSWDGSDNFVREHFPDTTLIKLARNYGFTGGVNAGIEAALKAGAKYVALFNNDAVAEPDWLERLVEAAESHPEAGIVTSRFVSIDGRHIDSTGDFYSTWGLPFPRGRGERNDPERYAEPGPVFGVSGGASLYRAEALERVGRFDDNFFAYYEDIDLSFRMHLAGWQVLYQPKAVAKHRIGATSQRIKGRNSLRMAAESESDKPSDFARYHSVKNFIFVYWKNMPLRLLIKYLPKFLLASLLMGLNSLRRGQVWPYLKAWAVALIKTPITLRHRYEIQRTAKIGVAEVERLLYPGLPPTQLRAIRFMSKLGIK